MTNKERIYNLETNEMVKELHERYTNCFIIL